MEPIIEPYHIPALLPQSIDALDVNPDGIYVDVTYGGGGHSAAILNALSEKGHLYSFDQDIDAVERAPKHDRRFTMVYGNFRFITNFLRYYGVDKVDGVLADLGVSFHHFDQSDRGFSFRFDQGELDMRMNRNASLTATQILESYTAEQLTAMWRTYGEFGQAHRLAARVISARNSGQPVRTVEQLNTLANGLISPKREKKELAQVYQALRIEVNHEMQALEQMLQGALKVLRPGGRLAVITYHSLEDRMVKNFMRTGRVDGRENKDFFGVNQAPIKPLGSKPIVPGDDEVIRNPRSRSAKLRVAIKL